MNNKKFLIWLAVIFFFIIIVICALPYLLTSYSILDFTNTGEIGDTIGGIMGPFIGILAAVVTFMAFWIQYKNNVNLLMLNNKKKIEEWLIKFYTV